MDKRSRGPHSLGRSSGQYLRLANGGIRSLGTNGRGLFFDAAIPFASMDGIHDGASHAPVSGFYCIWT